MTATSSGQLPVLAAERPVRLSRAPAAVSHGVSLKLAVAWSFALRSIAQLDDLIVPEHVVGT